MREVCALVVIESTATLPPQIYMSSAYGSACPEMVRAADAAVRSLNESVLVSPSNETISRAGASSLRRSLLSASGMPWTTFQRHDSAEKRCGSKPVWKPRYDAALRAVARSTTVPSSATSLYSVLLLKDASWLCCQPGGGPPAGEAEKRGMSGAG